MSKDIHPKCYNLTIQFPKGETFETVSTYSGGKLVLDVDFKTHPAWTGKGIARASDTSTTVTKFNKKFGSLDFSVGSKKSSDQAAQGKS